MERPPAHPGMSGSSPGRSPSSLTQGTVLSVFKWAAPKPAAPTTIIERPQAQQPPNTPKLPIHTTKLFFFFWSHGFCFVYVCLCFCKANLVRVCCCGSYETGATHEGVRHWPVAGRGQGCSRPGRRVSARVSTGTAAEPLASCPVHPTSDTLAPAQGGSDRLSPDMPLGLPELSQGWRPPLKSRVSGRQAGEVEPGPERVGLALGGFALEVPAVSPRGWLGVWDRIRESSPGGCWLRSPGYSSPGKDQAVNSTL